MLATELQYAVASQLGEAVPEIQCVFTKQVYTKDGEPFELEVWTIVRQRDHAVYRRIYDVEGQIILAHPSIGFEFTVMASNGRDPRTLMSGRGVELAFERT